MVAEKGCYQIKPQGDHLVGERVEYLREKGASATPLTPISAPGVQTFQIPKKNELNRIEEYMNFRFL